MPTSCQHFPRRALVDDRGTFVTLSHFCPTAAALLFEATGPMVVVTAPPAFPPGRHWDGLDARGHWPPLLSPGVLFDLDAYSAFEQFIVDRLAHETTVHAALETVAGAVERLREWNHRRGSFLAWANETFAETAPMAVILPDGGEGSSRAPLLQIGGLTSATHKGAHLQRAAWLLDVHALVRSSVPPHHEPAPLHADTARAWGNDVAPRWNDYAAVAARYVAAKGFGSWTAYQGRGARTLVAEMAVSAMVLEAEAASLCAKEGRALDQQLMLEAIRAADWLLIHLVDRSQFIEWLGVVEHQAR